jgi:hypothetical protein
MSTQDHGTCTGRPSPDLADRWMAWAAVVADPVVAEPTRRSHLDAAARAAGDPATRRAWLLLAGRLLLRWNPYVPAGEPWRRLLPHQLPAYDWRNRYPTSDSFGGEGASQLEIEHLPVPDPAAAEILHRVLAGPLPVGEWLAHGGWRWSEVDTALRCLWALARLDDPLIDLRFVMIRESWVALGDVTSASG